MWCLKCFRKYQGRALVLRPRPHNQVFQHWIFLVDGHNELLQFHNRHLKTDTANAITLLKCKDYSLFIFCSDVAVFVKVIDDEWKGR